jgi:hypothetical protein
MLALPSWDRGLFSCSSCVSWFRDRGLDGPYQPSASPRAMIWPTLRAIEFPPRLATEAHNWRTAAHESPDIYYRLIEELIGRQPRSRRRSDLSDSAHYWHTADCRPDSVDGATGTFLVSTLRTVCEETSPTESGRRIPRLP